MKINLADKNIKLNVKHNNPFKDKIINFYNKFDFLIDIKESNNDYYTMIRKSKNL